MALVGNIRSGLPLYSGKGCLIFLCVPSSPQVNNGAQVKNIRWHDICPATRADTLGKLEQRRNITNTKLSLRKEISGVRSEEGTDVKSGEQVPVPRPFFGGGQRQGWCVSQLPCTTLITYHKLGRLK